MRTTLTLDPDVAMKIKKRMADRKLTFKQTVNQALRDGLKAGETTRRKPKIETFSLEFKPGIDPHRLNQLLDQLEVEDYVRKVNR
jgi:hypothetical protein